MHITTCTGENFDVIYIYISGSLPKWENYALRHTAANVSRRLKISIVILSRNYLLQGSFRS